MLNLEWKQIRRILQILAIFLLIFVLAEFARLYFLFYRIDPILAYVMMGLLAILVVVLLINLIPRPQRPPIPSGDGFDQASHADMKDYCLYLTARLSGIAADERLPHELRGAAARQGMEIREMLKAHPLNDDLERAILNTETEVLPVVYAPAREQVQEETRQEARRVMMETAGGPYHGLEAGSAWIAALCLCWRAATLYPGAWTVLDKLTRTLASLRLAWAYNFMGSARALTKHLFTQAGMPRETADTLARTLNAGWFILCAGQAAITRCELGERRNIASLTMGLAVPFADLAAETRGIFTEEVLGEVQYALLPPRGLEPSQEEATFLNNLQHGIKAALDAVSRAKGGNPMPRPKTSLSMAPAPRFVPSPALETTDAAPPSHHVRRRRRPRGVSHVLGTFFQRIVYGARFRFRGQ